MTTPPRMSATITPSRAPGCRRPAGRPRTGASRHRGRTRRHRTGWTAGTGRPGWPPRPRCARTIVVADQRVRAGERVDQGDRDHRQGQDVGQEPLVEVGRQQQDHERHEPRAEDGECDRIGAEPDRQQAQRDRPDRCDRRRPPVDGADRAAPRRAPASGSPRRSAARPRTQAGGAEQDGQRLHRIGAAGWVGAPGGRSAGPRAGESQLDQRRVRDPGRATRRERQRLAEVGRCRAMSRWTHGTVTNSRRKRPLLTSEPSAEPEFVRSPYQLSISGT